MDSRSRWTGAPASPEGQRRRPGINRGTNETCTIVSERSVRESESGTIVDLLGTAEGRDIEFELGRLGLTGAYPDL